MKQDYRIITPYGEEVFTEPGNRGENDMRIFTRFPKLPWPHSLYYVGVITRLKGMVEDRNYLPKGGSGADFLVDFVNRCIKDRSISIAQICRDAKITLPNDKTACAICGQYTAEIEHEGKMICTFCQQALSGWEET